MQTPALAPPARSPLRPLVITTFCVYFGFGISTPVVPLFARDMGAGPGLVGLVVAAFGVAAFCFDLAGGPLAGRLGARRTAAGGALIIGLAALAGALAQNVGLLALSRLLTGAGSAIYATTAMNVIARTNAPARMGRAMSAYQGGLLLGTGFGPSVGGFVAGALGFRAPFVLYLAMAAVSVVISLAVLPDRLPERPARATGSEPAPGFAAVARDGAFQTALAVAFVVFILRIGVSGTAVPLYASDTLGLSRALVGLAVTVWALSNFAFLFHAGRLADRRPRGVAISVGLTLTLLALGMLGAWRHVAGLYLGMVLLGAATAYAGVTPAALIADVTPPAHTATAMGLYRMAIDFGIVAGPIAAGLLTDAAGSARTFYVLAVPALLVLLPALRLRDTRRA